MKKIFTLIITIFMLTAFLVACDKDDETVGTTETTEAVETTVEETEDTTAETEEETSKELLNVDISIFKDGESEFTIVQPESTNSDISKAGTSLKNAIKKQGGTSINFYKEGMYKTLNGGTMDGPKIVIGVLEEDEISRDIFESFDGYYYHYTIKVANGSLYIVGGSTEATVNAINYFIDTYLSANITSLEFEKDMNFTAKPEPPLSKLTINGNSIYDYTIVYYDSYYGKQYAYEVQKALIETIGIALPIIKDSGFKAEPEKELEILVGKTNRAESQAVRAEYERPNVYYDIVEVNSKLVVMGEGYTTLDIVSDKFNEYIDTLSATADIVGSIAHGDVIDSDNMLERADDTDIRVMMWNMAAPSVHGRSDLWEKQADVILMHFPDVLGTTEIYNTGAYKTQFDHVIRELSEFYVFFESEVDTEYGTPTHGKNPQNVLYRKDAGLSVSASGYRLLNPKVTFQGINWVVFEKDDGNKFIYTMTHYPNSYHTSTSPDIHIDFMNKLQKEYGYPSTLPAIISGDLYLAYGSVGYTALSKAKYKDSQRDALVNANNNISHGSTHGLGQNAGPTVKSVDLILYNAGFEALKHKIVVMQSALDSSDHNAAVTDFRF